MMCWLKIVCRKAFGAAILGAGMLFAVAATASETSVVVVTGVVYPGQEITPDMVRDVTLRKPLRIKQRIVLERSEIIGMVAQRTLLPGRTIPHAALREAYVVEAGTPVRASYLAGGLSISVIVVPLADGSAGDFVKVRNPDSGRVFSAEVLDDGSVVVGSL